jgi:hypothetical protein
MEKERKDLRGSVKKGPESRILFFFTTTQAPRLGTVT